MKPKVSVVVPIYGVEKYLPQCVDSLLKQTLTEIEVILVDDGSPDNSGRIADSYAQRDSRVRVIHQENRGLGPARNAGMGIAEGTYIGFVDSDDWVRPEFLQKLYTAAVRHDADIAVSGHSDVADEKILASKPHPLAGQTLESSEAIRRMRKTLFGHGLHDQCTEPFPMSVCMSLYRKDMIEAEGLGFQNVLSEDTVFNLDAYRCAKVVSFTDATDYCYRKEGQASITQTFSQDKLLRFQQFLTLLARMARQEKDEDCMMRAGRTAIDYCRLYVGLAANADAGFAEKKKYICTFAETEAIRNCWEGYPLSFLPLQQRIFHRMILKRHYGTALLLNWLRRDMGKGCGFPGRRT